MVKVVIMVADDRRRGGFNVSVCLPLPSQTHASTVFVDSSVGLGGIRPSMTLRANWTKSALEAFPFYNVDDNREWMMPCEQSSSQLTFTA